MVLMVSFLQMMNNLPNNVSRSGNLMYLLISRPIFIIGFSMNIFPILIGSDVFKPIRKLLSSSFWYPFSRLSYGAFLSHGIFMQFREFNVERGQWGCAFDAILMFLAYVTFSFLFSLYMALTLELPISYIIRQRFNKKKEI